MTLQELIDQGEELRSEDYDSPDIDMWQSDVSAAVQPYGEAATKALKSAYWFGLAIRSRNHGNEMSNTMISKVQKLLQNLQKRDQAATRAASDLAGGSEKEDVREAMAKQLHVTINGGSVNLGDNGQISNVDIGSLIIALQSEVEKLPDSDAKRGLFANLRAITENPTFAAIAGVSVSTLLAGFLGSQGKQ